MKIQFIVVGWYYSFDVLNKGLKELNDENENIDVFWTCHNEPSDWVKDNFNYKVFDNIGDEYGAYQQAIDHLSIEDNTYVFFIHDDMIIKDWAFINKCIELLNKGYKCVGNCREYDMHCDPFRTDTCGMWSGRPMNEFVGEKNKHIYDTPMNIKKVRGSFMAIKMKDVTHVGQFDPPLSLMVGPKVREDGTTYFEGDSGRGGYGNLLMELFSYKLCKFFGQERIAYLSNRYLDSEYMYECGRGKLDPNHPML